MLDALAHRGPDDGASEQDEHAVLGHRRLAIIDLDGGRQPLRNEDGSVWLVCNGEIYNHLTLRKELEAGGYRFQTHSDCEVILALYQRDGDELLRHLRGMFSFALWDSRKRRLLAARDHLGQKPFYYAHTSQGFAFASEIKALLALDPSLRKPDLAALEQYFTLRLIAPPRSMFAGVSKLPPGHRLIVEDDRAPRIEAYWDLSFGPKLTGSDDDLLDELEEKLEDTLRLHLTSDVPVGALLSGGLDSSLLVAMLAKRVGVKNLPTFTVGLPHESYDEAPHARAIARMYGTEHHEDSLAPTLISRLPDVVHYLDEPSDPLSLCTYHVAGLARSHVKVVIGGDGGDELFGGYDRYYGNQYATHYSRVPAAVRRFVLGPLLSMIPEAGWYKSVGHQLRWLHRISSFPDHDRYGESLSYFYFDGERRRELFTPDMLTGLSGSDPIGVIREPFQHADGDMLDRMLYADSKIRLPDHPAMITDRMSMAHGLEARSPFMDHRLAEFVARMRSTLKVRGRTLRIAQRRLASRYLPAQIVSRPKQGFASALPYILQNQYRQLYERLLTRSALAEAGILRREPIRALVDSHLAGRADHGHRLWLLINAELWFRMQIQGVSRDVLREEMEPDAVASPPQPRRHLQTSEIAARTTA